MKRPLGARRGNVGAKYQRVGTLGGYALQRSRNIQFYTAKTGGLHLRAGHHEVEHHRHAGLGHAEVVNDDLRQLGQFVCVRRQRRGIGVDLGVPAAGGVSAPGKRHQFIDTVDAAAKHVKAQRTHANGREPGDFIVANRVGHLRHPDPAPAQPGQQALQVTLVKGLE